MTYFILGVRKVCSCSKQGQSGKGRFEKRQVCGLLSRGALILIGIYQKIFSPLLGRNCRFYPSCSEYSRLAIKKYGFWKGIFLAWHRLWRCHPFNKGGIDFPEWFF